MEACEILAVHPHVIIATTQLLTPTIQDSNRIQQMFSAEKRPTLWRALPAIEEPQTTWEAKCNNPRYVTY